jgi:hypothetical protein
MRLCAGNFFEWVKLLELIIHDYTVDPFTLDPFTL